MRTLSSFNNRRSGNRTSSSKVFFRVRRNLRILDEASNYLTTFNTPFDRYKFNRQSFGISSAPEVFQRVMHQIFE